MKISSNKKVRDCEDYWSLITEYESSMDRYSVPQIIEKLKEDDCHENRMLLVTNNLPLVVFTINKYFGNIEFGDMEDIISTGTIGLVSAALTYDINSGTAFSAYAIQGIFFKIQNFVKTKSNHFNASTDSLYREVNSGHPMNNGDEPKCMIDLLPDPDSEFFDEPIYDEERKNFAQWVINNCGLTPNEYDITWAYYGFDNGEKKTMPQVAELLNKSRSAIQKGLERSLAKMRKFIQSQLPGITYEMVA